MFLLHAVNSFIFSRVENDTSLTQIDGRVNKKQTCFERIGLSQQSIRKDLEDTKIDVRDRYRRSSSKSDAFNFCTIALRKSKNSSLFRPASCGLNRHCSLAMGGGKFRRKTTLNSSTEITPSFSVRNHGD